MRRKMRMLSLGDLLFLYFVFLLASCFNLSAQDSAALPTQQELNIRKRTILAQFDSEMVESADVRLQKKLDRRQLILRRQAIIDTLDISERRRRRLLKELYNSPLSDRWERLVTKLEIDEDPDFD